MLVLGQYFGKRFLLWFSLVLLTVLVLIALFDWAELMRRAVHKPLATIFITGKMVLLRLPHTAGKLLPFISLFASITTLWSLNRTNEITAAKAAGISIWQVLIPFVIVLMGINTLNLAVVNPLGAAMMTHYDQLESLYLRGYSHRVAVAQSGFWIRQIDLDGYTLIYAQELDSKTSVLKNATFIRFTTNDAFQERIDAAEARLVRQSWELEQVWRAQQGRPPQQHSRHYVTTALTPKEIADSATPASNLSFWQLPGFIRTFEKSGLSPLKYVLYWHDLLAKPIFCLGMLILAACVALRPARQGRVATRLAFGISIGFVSYIISDVTMAMAYSAALPSLLAAWGLPLLMIFGSSVWLLHQEEA
jgi:lipopolysaccharide export system permease protein